MASLGSLNPVAIQQWFDNNGDPLAGGKLFFYLAGTTTPSPVYNNQTLTTPLANPLILDAAGRAPQHYLDALSYKEVLKSASDVTIWTADNVTSPAALRNTQAIISITGTQHDVPVPAGLVTFLIFTNTAAVTIDGFSGGSQGQLLVLRAGNFAPVHLLHTNPASAAGNQLFNFVSTGATSLAGPHGVAVYLHDGNYWVLVTHEQGQSIRVPYAAGNFVGVGGTTPLWTVEAADVTKQDYLLEGSTCTITVEVHNSTVSGGPSFLLAHGFPYQARLNNTLPALAQNGFATTFDSVVISTDVNQRWVGFTRAANTPWANMTDALTVFGQLKLDVL